MDSALEVKISFYGIKKHDILFLNETWISEKDQTDLNINGFNCEHIYGNKAQNTVKGRFSGGIAIYYKSYLSKYITVVYKKQEGLLWVKISPDILNTTKPAFICHVYIPPKMSTVLNDVDLFDMLEYDFNYYSSQGDTYM